MALADIVATSHWLIAWDLSSESRKEFEVYWIELKGNITKNKIDQGK
jgi:hypothetical protein